MSSNVATTWGASHGKLLLAVAMSPKEIGQRIQAARERRGLTQVQFAHEANVSPSSVTRWEGGKLPPVRELIRIAELLDIEPAELVETVDESQADRLEQIKHEAQAAHDEAALTRAEIQQLQATVDRLLETLGVAPGQHQEQPAKPGSQAGSR